MVQLYHNRNVNKNSLLFKVDYTSYRINGIIGSALSHRETMTKEEIYNLLNIKLRRSDIAEFVFHRKFEKFIYSKSVEKSL